MPMVKNNILITYPSWELRDIVLLFKLTGHFESKQNKILKKKTPRGKDLERSMEI